MGERHAGRRADDQNLLEYVSRTATWVKRGPRLLVGVFGLMTGVAGCAAWFGAQASSPGQRMTRFEHQTNERFDVLEQRIDTIVVAVDSLRVDSQAQRRDRERLWADVTLLLRLGCRPITDTDLRQDCVDRGTRR